MLPMSFPAVVFISADDVIAPVTVNPALAVSRPVDVIVPVPDVEIAPDVEIFPELVIAPTAVIAFVPIFKAPMVPDTVNAPPIVVDDVELPIVVAPTPAPVLVFIFTAWVDTVVNL